LCKWSINPTGATRGHFAIALKIKAMRYLSSVFRAALEIDFEGGCGATSQYSSANITVMTRSVTDGSVGSGEWY
jgi:hypothetical protein